jgi:hypothetical protein
MNRLFALVGSAVVVGLVGWSPPAPAQTVPSRPIPDGQGRRAALAFAGSIEGRVVDERGMPLTGAMVSALGSTSAVAVTDTGGAFALRALPAGSYMVRAHMSGFAPSGRQLVEVGAASSARYSITLQRFTPGPAASGKPQPPPPPPKLIAAGLAPVDLGFDPLGPDPLGARGDSANGAEDRTEKAWRIRHLPRSVLKTTTDRAAATSPAGSGATASTETVQPRTGTAMAHAMGAPVRLLGDLPLTGQVNLMTSGSFDGSPGVWASDSAIRGTAYLAVAGPVRGYGDWSARVVTQADLGSWFMSGSFHNRAPSRNLFNIGFSYSTQRMTSNGSLAHLGIERPELAGRAAGTLYGVGQVVLSRRLTVDYGARYSHYDYLSGGLFSPSVIVTLVPVDRFRVKAGAAREMLAPGAEEFMEPLTSVFWVPPDRTFVGYSPMVPERTFQYTFALEHDLTPALMLSFKSTYQNTTNQQIAFFGGPATGEPATWERQRHYGIGNAGDFVARGWSVGVTHHLLSRLRGSVAYEVTDARWLPAEPGAELLLLGYRPRPAGERLQDLTTSVETVLPVTATQVYVAYRFNTGFARFGGSDTPGTGLDSRFDVQITQRLPSFGFTSAQWQVLVAVKNLFRDASKDGSYYDELFVVRPPTRILGGVVVRF